MDRDAEGPVSPVAELLQGIWGEILGIDRVPADGDFFELGGHSLLATQVVSRLREVLGIDLPLRRLFQSSRLDALAREVEVALGAAQGEAAGAAPPIEPVPREAPPPASFAQQRLWFLDRLEPGGSAYNVFTALRLAGLLDRAALVRSVGEIWRRHDVLRTTFAEVGGEPVQVIAPAGPVPPCITADLVGLPPARRAAEVRRLLAGEAVRPFDLARGPVFQVALIRLGAGEHLLAVRMHHIVSDAWSRGVLVRELARAYTAFAAGRPSPLPALPVQYADFAHWQRRWLTGEVLERQLGYWRERLAGAPAALELPTDRARPPAWDSRGARQPVRLPPDLAAALRTLGRRRGATLFMVLLAAFETLLHRCTGQDDLSVGSPIAGRNRSEIEPLIGFFVNTLVLRTRLAGNLPFSRLLERVRETALGAYEHQDLPFERLVEELVPVRSLDRPPLFQVVFALQSAGGDRLELPGLELRPVEVAGRTAKFELTLALAQRGEELSGWLEYPTALFDATTMARMALHWRTLLAGIVAEPEARLSSLPLLSEAERRQVLEEWNATSTPYPREATIHGLFAAQAAATPESVAVVFAGRELRYRELASASRRLARRLGSAGVGPEVRVGLWMERSLELPVALLAVLEAGGAYVPLDPDYPAERLAFMMADAGLSVLLAQGSLMDRLPPHELPVVLLKEGEAAAEGAATDGLVPHLEPSATGPESLAYIMYTSGSTGRPNGVCVPHRGVVRLVRETGYAALGADEV
ncbi:MAG TPA: condensation domain-containing protein, partial [Thermoanaerobaculia bacterium]|nr:condensation domain-containing protein [Thermoanaerobaculia bacterium]